MPKERNEYSIQGRDMVAKYGAVTCQHLYKWINFVIPKGFRDFASILDKVLEDLDFRKLFVEFMQNPTEEIRDRLMNEMPFDSTLYLYLVGSKSGSPSWEALKWVYSDPQHYFEVLRVVYGVRPDIPVRYKKISSALLNFFEIRLPSELPEGAELPVPKPRKPYGSRSKKVEEDTSDSESATMDPGREERIFSKVSGRVLDIMNESGLTLDSPRRAIHSVFAVRKDCPLAYKCTQGTECLKCERLGSVLTELCHRASEDKVPEVIKRAMLRGGDIEALREAARNAAKAAVLDGLRCTRQDIDEFVKKVLHELF